MTDLRQVIITVVASVLVGCVTGYGSFWFGQGQMLERVDGISARTDALAQKDTEILDQLNRIDREGTQISRADRAALAELKIRFDRMESQQAIAIAQNARNEALLLDLKARLRQ